MPFVAAAVSWASLSKVYAEMRSELIAEGASVTAFDAALGAFDRLPHDDCGDFDGPPMTGTPDSSCPRARAMGPAGGEELGMAEWDSAVDCGVLVRVAAGVPDEKFQSAAPGASDRKSTSDPQFIESISDLPRGSGDRFESATATSSPATWGVSLEEAWEGAWHPVFAVWRSGSNRARARLIADLRGVNALFPPPPTFVLPSFASAIQWDKVKYMMKLDLVSAFWAVRVSRRLQSLFQCRAPSGRAGVYSWVGLPMGWSYSPFLFHTMLEPVLEFVRAKGHRVGKYLDDFVVAALESSSCARAFACLVAAVERCGFAYCRKKTSSEPVRDLVFLGMGIDTVSEAFYWPADKAASIVGWARAMHGERRVPRAALQSWLGKAAFLCQVCPLLASWRRSLERSLAPLESGDLPGNITVTDAMSEELTFWSNVDVMIGTTFPFAGASRVVVSTDASDTGGGVRVCFANGEWREYAVSLPMELRAASSGAREMYVSLQGLRVLEALSVPLWRVCVDIYTDSTASAGALRRGGRRNEMIDISRDILGFQVRHGASISVHWVPREGMVREDELSRVGRGDGAAIVRAAYETITTFGFGRPAEYDMFADAGNTVCRDFASLVPGQGVAYDGLRVPVRAFTWAFPPFQLARVAARHLASSGLQAILVAPTGTIAQGWSCCIRMPADLPVLLRAPTFDPPAVCAPLPLTAYVYGGVRPHGVRSEVSMGRNYEVVECTWT